MGVEQQATAAAGVDAIQFGVMLGKMDVLLSGFEELKKDMRDNYATRREVGDLERRVGTLEDAPNKKTALVIAVCACVFAGLSGIGAVVALFLR